MLLLFSVLFLQLLLRLNFFIDKPSLYLFVFSYDYKLLSKFQSSGEDLSSFAISNATTPAVNGRLFLKLFMSSEIISSIVRKCQKAQTRDSEIIKNGSEIMEEEKIPFREKEERCFCSRRKILIGLFLAFFLAFPVSLTIMILG